MSFRPMKENQMPSRLAEFTLTGPITAEVAERFVHWLQVNRWATVLTVNIDSTGGNAAATARMVAAFLNHSALSKVTRCTGRAFSGAALIFACGTRRLIVPGGALMIHPAHIDGDRHAGKCPGYTELMTKFFAERMELSEQQVSHWMHAETCFTAARAIRFGLATAFDTVTNPTSRPNLAGRPLAVTSTARQIVEHGRRQKFQSVNWVASFLREWERTSKPMTATDKAELRQRVAIGAALAAGSGSHQPYRIVVSV